MDPIYSWQFHTCHMDFVCGVFYTWNTLFYENGMWAIYFTLLKGSAHMPLAGVIYWFSSASTPNPSTHSLNIYLFYFLFHASLCKLEFMWIFNSVVYLCINFFPNWNVTKKCRDFNLLTEFSAARKRVEIYWSFNIYLLNEYISILTTIWLTAYKYGFTYLPSLYHFLGIIFFNK